MTNPQPLDHFSKNNKTKDRLCYRCKSCVKDHNASSANKVKAKNKRWKAANPSNRKNYELKKNYGINLDQYNSMLLQQNNCCAICQKNQSELKQALNVDHCHTTGKVRGLLCENCNRGLGIFKDNTDLLISAVQYLSVV